MANSVHTTIGSSYRAFYGKLFASLFSQFGVSYVNEIEDAIQNSFLKSLKSWKPNKIPDNKENWLYIVARNDVINQIKRQNNTEELFYNTVIEEKKEIQEQEDLRLQTIFFIANLERISSQIKIIFILKNIFGLSVKGISESTLLKQDAIYKSIKRAKNSLHLKFKSITSITSVKELTTSQISITEEILYAVFNVGFDSFSEKNRNIVNKDVCLEALSLVKLFIEKSNRNSTKSLLSLFCFHIARIPAKVNDGKLIPFFEQDRLEWKNDFIKLGFYYLKKPKKLNKFYLEALIVSKYMTTIVYDSEHWNTIVKLYTLLTELSNSPIIKLNLCYSLHKADKTEEALQLLKLVEEELPNEHVYFSLVKATIIRKSNFKEANIIINSLIDTVNPPMRKEYLLERLCT